MEKTNTHTNEKDEKDDKSENAKEILEDCGYG
jgi:hypothetical protein